MGEEPEATFFLALIAENGWMDGWLDGWLAGWGCGCGTGKLEDAAKVLMYLKSETGRLGRLGREKERGSGWGS